MYATILSTLAFNKYSLLTRNLIKLWRKIKINFLHRFIFELVKCKVYYNLINFWSILHCYILEVYILQLNWLEIWCYITLLFSRYLLTYISYSCNFFFIASQFWILFYFLKILLCTYWYCAFYTICTYV